MVILMPLMDGEELRNCTSCTTVGLMSRLTERSTFRKRGDRKDGFSLQCRSCLSRLVRENHAVRLAKETPEERLAKRVKWRQSRKRLKAKDPEKFERKHQNANRRHEKRRRVMLGVETVRQDARIKNALIRERKGKSLPDPVRRKTALSGRLLPVGPLQRWIRELVRREEMEGYGRSSLARVAANLDYDHNNLLKLLKRTDPVDEDVVDRFCTQHGGVTMRDLYRCYDKPGAKEPDPPALKPGLLAGPGACADPRCSETAGWAVEATSRGGRSTKSVMIAVAEDAAGRFCKPHAERLARLRVEVERDGALMSANGGAQKKQSTVKTRKQVPTCTNPNCWNERTAGDAFCYSCQDGGYREDDQG